MENRLFAIMTIGAVLTAVFGVWMLMIIPGLLQTGWFHVKLLLLLGLARLSLALFWLDRRARQRTVGGHALAALVQRDAECPPDRDRPAGNPQAFLDRAISLSNTVSQRFGHQRGRGGNSCGYALRPSSSMPAHRRVA